MTASPFTIVQQHGGFWWYLYTDGHFNSSGPFETPEAAFTNFDRFRQQVNR